MKYLFTLVLFVIGLNSIHATTYSTVQSGNWNSASTWDNGVPSNPLTGNDKIIINVGHTVTLSADKTLQDNSSLTIDGKLILDNELEFETFGTSSFTINGMVTLDDQAEIHTNGSSSLINNATMTLLNSSKIQVQVASSFTNNGMVTLENNTFIQTSGTSTFYTCDPPPVYDNIKIKDLSSGNATLAPVPVGNPCDGGTGEWDGDCNCILTPNSIPTLSQWGLIILGLCLSVLGIVVVRNKLVNPA